MLTSNFYCDNSDRVAVGRALDLPVYFGDAGSREVKLVSIITRILSTLNQSDNFCALEICRSCIRLELRELVLQQ